MHHLRRSPNDPPAGGGEAPAPAATPPPEAPPAATPPLEAPPEQTAHDFIEKDGTFKPGWQQFFKIEEDAIPSLTHPNIAELGTSHYHTKKMVGEKHELPSPPGPGATEDELASYNDTVRKILGSPETADGYENYRPEGVPDELWDEGRAKGFIENVATKHNLTQEAVADILKYEVDALTASDQAQEAAVAQLDAQDAQHLKEYWGSDHDRQIKAAERVMMTGGLPLDHPFRKEADFMKFAASMASLVSADKLVAGDGIGAPQSRAERANADLNNPQNSRRSRAYNGEFGEAEQERAAAEIRADLKS